MVIFFSAFLIHMERMEINSLNLLTVPPFSGSPPVLSAVYSFFLFLRPVPGRIQPDLYGPRVNNKTEDRLPEYSTAAPMRNTMKQTAISL